jgi:hypothetical protein
MRECGCICVVFLDGWISVYLPAKPRMVCTVSADMFRHFCLLRPSHVHSSATNFNIPDAEGYY